MAPTTRTSTSGSTDPILDQSSPYFVHSSDGPSSVSVKPVLTGSNYQSWACAMRRALGGKMKYEFVDGTLPVVTDPSYRAWNQCNMLVHSWIMNSESIGQSIGQGDYVRTSELMQEIYNLQQDSMIVTEFYSELKVLWEELEIYMPVP
jgi:hypothetical protein